MPAGPEARHLVATEWPPQYTWRDYPGFRRAVTEECLRLGAPVPDDRHLENEYETRVVQITRMLAAEEIHRFNSERPGMGRR